MTTSWALHRASDPIDGAVGDAPAARDNHANGRAAAQLPDPSLTLAIVDSRAGFDALEPEWNDLFERAGRDTHVFQTFNWCWHWANHFLAAGQQPAALRLAIVTGRRDGRLVMLWPLVVSETHFVRRVSWLGQPVSQYGDILIEPSADSTRMMRSGLEFLIARVRPDVLHLRKVRADANIATLLAELNALVLVQQEAPYLDLSSAASFEDYEERYPSKARKNRRRLLRRLAERGTIAFERHGDGGPARTLTGLAISLKRAQLNARGVLSPAVSDPRTLACLMDAADGRGRPTGCHVAVLTSGGEQASIQVGFACKGRLALHVITYSLKFEKAGVGVLHLEDSIRRGFHEGLRCYDLLAPRADYKMDWADGVVAVTDYAKPVTLIGTIYGRIYLSALRQRLKAFAQRLPDGLRQAFASRYAAVRG